MNSNTPEQVLKTYFGYETFRNGQKQIISHILNGEDCLGIMPTGAGKSICYQVPACMFDGITIVISPLISLMKDQVDSLNQIGISSTYINSTLSDKEYFQTIDNVSHNIYKIIYVAPERLESERFINLLNTLEISMIAIDEAHCVSQWGHDFRPSYRKIAEIIDSLEKRPIVTAFTATATKRVEQDIINLLQLDNPFTLITGFDRKNLYFSVQTPNKKIDFVLDYLDKHINEPGIIYCSTRKNVDSLFEKLDSKNYSVCKYHAGMSEKQRTKAQDDFIFDKKDIIIATNAFGMGIDKSNVRFVIHYNMPADLESYYQEAGRAGRDSDNAECILLFSRSDVNTNKFLIEKSSPETQPNEYQKLNEIIDYCNTDSCLRKYILEYFGEEADFENCNYCSNCNSIAEVTDITIDSQKILSCIKRVHERFGAGVITDILKGSNTSKNRDFGFDRLSTFGIMKEYTKDTIRDLISFLIAEDYIQTIGNKYPTLALTEKSGSILFKNEKVFIKKKIEKIEEKEKQEKHINKENIEFNPNLFEVLRQLRREIANENNVPPFIIFADTSLKQMAAYQPITESEMLAISGVGEFKMEKYGDRFIDAIKDFQESL